MYLKNLRKSKKIKQNEVYSILKIDRGTFRKLENNDTELRADWIPVLSKIYQVDRHDILDGYLREKGGLKIE